MNPPYMESSNVIAQLIELRLHLLNNVCIEKIM